MASEVMADFYAMTQLGEVGIAWAVPICLSTTLRRL
jgi:hypothetical protein